MFCHRFGLLFRVMVIIYTVNAMVCITEYLDDNDVEDIESTREQIQESTFQTPDVQWTTKAVKDIAHYLRNYKFNEWDRRYYHETPHSGIGYYNAFPYPPLKSLHWKVYENCFKDFYRCIIYLHSIISNAPFTRNDDTTVILNERSASIVNSSIENLDLECRKALINSDKSGLPFDGPQEKFQWRTTASYYMCWFTMMGTLDLSMLGESCDNFANCLEPFYGQHHRDFRSDDKQSFACATYSFCPDPCCPIAYAETLANCNINNANPCFKENSDRLSDIQCTMVRSDNQNFKDIIANKWNVSCKCKEIGFQWNSQFGMCVDINECSTGNNSCNTTSEHCLNLAGTYQCICKWGFALNLKTKKCEKAQLLEATTKKFIATVSDKLFIEEIWEDLKYVFSFVTV